MLASHALPGTHPFWFRLFFLHADLGVRVFFVISGYLITSLLLKEEKVSLKRFYIRRTRRILPAFLVFLVCVAIVGLPPGNWPYVLTYTVNFDPHPPWLIGHLWSLSVEEQFYILWPLVVAFTRRSVWVGVAVAAVFAYLPKIIDPALHYAFPYVCGPIAMGCLLALYSAKVRTFVTALPGWLVVAAVPVIILLDTLDVKLITNVLVTLCAARVVFVPPAFLNWPPLMWLGRISYSLYLFQQLFLDSISGKPVIALPFPLNLAGALGAAVLSYYLVETPTRRSRTG